MIFDSTDYDDHENVIFIRDRASGLAGIIGIHSTALGPALGGCRMVLYSSEAEAARDVLRLSRGMTYKNALADLPLGGGKMVVIGNPRAGKSPALFAAVGQAVERLRGQYIVGQDVGTGIPEMDVIRQNTNHVVGREVSAGGTVTHQSTRRLAYFTASTSLRERDWEGPAWPVCEFLFRALEMWVGILPSVCTAQAQCLLLRTSIRSARQQRVSRSTQE
jgi:glutamate dehydrogenase/leucine dehydrogenase